MKKLLLGLIILLSSIGKGQTLEWVKQLDSPGGSIHIDSKGNIYKYNGFSGTVDFDPSIGVMNLISNGGYDIAICKYDSVGNLKWGRSFGGTFDDYATSFYIDSLDHIFLSGTFDGTADLNPDTIIQNYSSLGASDIFLISIDTIGQTNWIKTIGGNGDEYIAGIKSDKYNNLHLWGNFKNTVDFDPNTPIYQMTAISVDDQFICKLDINGNFMWSRQMSGGSIYGLDINLNGDIYFTGAISGTMNFEPFGSAYSLISSGISDIFICKYLSTGNFAWAKQMGGPNQEFGISLTVDASQNIITSGIFKGTCDFDPGPNVHNLTALSFNDIYYSKVDSIGNFIWVSNIEGGLSSFSDSPGMLISDSRNNIYSTGTFMGIQDIDPSPGVVSINSAGHDDVYLIKLNTNGNLIWGGKIGSPFLDGGGSIALTPNENILFSAEFQSTADVDPGIGSYTINSSGGYDSFILKLSQNVCSNLTILFDSVKNKDCSGPGLAEASAVDGYGPYSFFWNTTPPINDSIATFSADGIYSVSVTDINGCTRSTSLLINGPIAGAFDLVPNLIAGNFRSGFQSHLIIDGSNQGCNLSTGNLTLVLDSLVSFDSASVSPDLIIGDTLMWNFTDLAYDSTHVISHLYLRTDTAAVIGDSVHFSIFMNPLGGDFDTSNNLKTYTFPVIAAYDPNDKNVYPSGKCDNNLVSPDQLLTYTVRFQNTGNADAINIFIIDTLDTDLDLSTVRVVGFSDPVITEVLPSNVLKFRFDNIHLPDSTSNEPESHGYVIFEVKPLAGLLNGTEIKNDVGIYFDFNPPIYTNTVKNTIIDVVPTTCNSVGISEKNIKDDLQIYPNPTAGIFTIITSSPTEISISNILGETILRKKIKVSDNIDISELRNGVYFIRTIEGSTLKVIKQ